MNTILLMRLVSRSRTLLGRSSDCVCVLPRNTPPLRVTAIRMASLLSASCIAMGFLVFTMSTCTPCCNMGVITMKMMRSTSITSTIGVTLISDTGCSSLALLNSTFIAVPRETRQEKGDPGGSPPINSPDSGSRLLGRPPNLLADAGAALRALQEVVDQLGAGVTHLDVEGFNLVGEIVERPDRRQRYEQTDRGGDQGFGNAACHRAQTSRLLGRDALERIDDADDGSKQSHEGGGRTDGRQAADTTFQLGADDRLGPVQGALGRVDLLPWDFGADLVGLKLLQAGDDDLCQMALFVAVGDLNGFVQLTFAQCASHRRSKRAGLLAGGAVSHHAVNHDANRIGRHDEQQNHHQLGQRSHLIPHGTRVETDRFLEQIKRPELQLHNHCLFFSCELIFSLPEYDSGPTDSR